jgi:hypothetical protein
VSDQDGGGASDSVGDNTSAATIDQLDFVGDLNGSANALASELTTTANNGLDSGSGGGGISFGENQVRTFETDASERKNEYMTDDADADDDDDSDRLQIGGDIKLDTLDIHTLNDMQSINAPPLLDDIEVLA